MEPEPEPPAAWAAIDAVPRQHGAAADASRGPSFAADTSRGQRFAADTSRGQRFAADASRGQRFGAASRGPDVGPYEQGTAASRWALARYLVGRALGESVGRGLLILALVVLGVAGLAQWAGATVWAVLIALIALGLLAMRALVRSLLRRLTAGDGLAGVEQQLRALVAATRRDVHRELRRVGLPGHTWTLPLLALRLLRSRRRAETMARLRSFRVDNVVSRTRLDELHLALQRGGVAARR